MCNQANKQTNKQTNRQTVMKIIPPKFFYVVNLVVLIGNLFISRCKRNKKLILFTRYLDLIKDTVVVMEQNANVKDENESCMKKNFLLKYAIRDTA